jgi:Kef-type K+ transport system membrane component KefB
VPVAVCWAWYILEGVIAALPGPLLAAGSVDPLVAEIGICFVVAGVLALVCDRLRLPSIAAFILAGLAIGPEGLGLVPTAANVETIAKLGLVFLLFLVGLEIDLKALLARGKTVVVTGVLQMPLCVALAYGACVGARALGLVPAGFDDRALVYLALATGFSSTLLVVKVLQERAQMDTVDGRVALAILVFQDIWAIIVLSLQPSLLGGASADLAATLIPVAKTFAGVAVLVIVGALAAMLVLTPLFRAVARSPELIILTALAWCFAMGMLGAKTGLLVQAVGIPYDISTSMEMGALVGGAAIAAFPYAHEVLSKVGLLRDFFVTLFFIALGMTVAIPRDPGLVVAALTLVVLAMALRAVVFLPLLWGTGLGQRNATTTSVKMAQISEFALVIAFLGFGLGHISEEVVTVVILAFVVTAILTPALFSVAEQTHAGFERFLAALGIDPRKAGGEGTADKDHRRLVLLGFHRLAASLVQELERSRPGLLHDTLVVDMNVAIHERLRAMGLAVQYGDIGNRDALSHALHHADVVVVTVADDLLKGTSNANVVRTIKGVAPHVKVYAQALRPSDAAELREAGADYVFAWHVAAATQLFPAIEAGLNGQLEGLDATEVAEGTALAGRVDLLA